MEICGSVLLFHQRGHTTIHPRPKFTTSFSGSCLSSFLLADQVDSSFDPRRPPASRCSPLRPDSNLLYVVCGHFLDCHRNLVRRFWNPYPFFFFKCHQENRFFFFFKEASSSTQNAGHNLLKEKTKKSQMGKEKRKKEKKKKIMSIWNLCYVGFGWMTIKCSRFNHWCLGFGLFGFFWGLVGFRVGRLKLYARSPLLFFFPKVVQLSFFRLFCMYFSKMCQN